jgi:hypothetical protein
MSRPVPSSHIAARLKQARQAVFPSAAAAAEALGMNAVTLRTHEAGTRGVSFPDLDRYARRYGVSFEWLVQGKGEREPQAEPRYQAGELVNIMGVLEDGKRHPGTLDDQYAPGFGPIPIGDPPLQPYEYEVAMYDDPRFPEEFVQAFRVRTKLIDGPYIDGTIVFGVPAYALGVREGDHVVIAHSKAGETEWTLRRALGQGRYAALLSDSPDLVWADRDDGQETIVHAVVTSLSARRQVPALPMTERVEHERSEAFWRKKYLSERKSGLPDT